MSNKVIDTDIKNRTYYFFNHMNNIKNFDPNNTKTDDYVGYVMIKDSKYVKINTANPLYIIFIKLNGYFKKT